MKRSTVTVPGVNLCFHNYMQQGDLIVCLHVLVVRTNLVFWFENKLLESNSTIQAKCNNEYFKCPISITAPEIIKKTILCSFPVFTVRTKKFRNK